MHPSPILAPDVQQLPLVRSTEPIEGEPGVGGVLAPLKGVQVADIGCHPGAKGGRVADGRLEVAALGPADQADELLEIKEQLAERGAGEDVLEPIDAAVTARGGTGSGRLADDFKHPRTWAPFVHSGLP